MRESNLRWRLHKGEVNQAAVRFQGGVKSFVFTCNF